MPRHPRRRYLLALADGELGLAPALRIRVHLLRCHRCRTLVKGMESERRAVASALAALGSRGEAEEGWARFITATGTRQPRVPSALRAAVVLLVGAALALLLRSPGRVRIAELNTIARELAARPDGEASRPAREGTADVRFVDVIDALRRAGQAQVVRDECCADHDAEGPPDDGLLALRLSQPATSVLVMYDDVDRSRSLSRGDLVRWVSLTPDDQAQGALPAQLATAVR